MTIFKCISNTTPRLTVFLILFFAVFAQAGGLYRDELPGRQVKVAAICIGFGGEHDAKLKLALEHLHTAGIQGVDIACLPEEFAGTKAEPLEGPTVRAVAQLANKYKMYVICPIREQAEDKQYNTSVLIDRSGKIAGYYRKIFVFWGEGVHCSTEGVKAFDTDFGRIGILTCFDINFPELWLKCDELKVDIVFWPSAYDGGCPLNAYAMLHNYYIVPVGRGNIIDITGRTVQDIHKPLENQFIAVLDLDETIVHYDFNSKKIKRLIAENKDDIALAKQYPLESWYLLKAVKPGIQVRRLCTENEIETLRQYRHRSREQINRARKQDKRI